jgi:dipeptidyl aminopeptidase/acylaminoacyl peptidase
MNWEFKSEMAITDRNKFVSLTIFIILLLATVVSAVEAKRPADGAAVSKIRNLKTKKLTFYSIVYMSGGLKVRGRLIVPAGACADRRKCKPLPGVVFNHGGVDGVPKPLMKRAEQLAESGYIVLAPSYRGEDGSEGEVEVAAGEVDDVLNAAAVLRAMPEADPKRIGMIGASHGGIITLLAIERDHTLSAAVCAYGVTNTFTWYKYLVESGHDVTDPLSVKMYGKGPEDRPEAFRRRAPALDAQLISTPLLLLYGDKDTTVPASQGRELADAIDRAGIHYEYRLIPDVGHGFLFFTDPARRSALEIRRSGEAWSMVVGFLDKYLK